jgi:hypothetical protein
MELAAALNIRNITLAVPVYVADGAAREGRLR